MTKLLFICHGNICRSTMAEYVMKDLVRRAGLQEQVYIDSAATSREAIGEGVHPGTRRKLREAGVPCGDHRARQVTAQDYRQFDLLIAMDGQNLRNLDRLLGGDPQHKFRLLLDYAASGGDIADPWYTGNFDDTSRDVLAGCTGLLEQLR